MDPRPTQGNAGMSNPLYGATLDVYDVNISTITR